MSDQSDQLPRIVSTDGQPVDAPATACADAPTPELESLIAQLSAVIRNSFATAATLIASIEAAASDMGKIDQVQLSRLMIASGHEIKRRAERREDKAA
jgi:hypothetical protein